MNEIKTLGLLCSGGDGPGMNCAIRSVVRTAISKKLNIYGIRKGYKGLLEEQFIKMDARSVANIIQRGGTILQTSRYSEFHREDTRQEAYSILKRKGIDGLVVIGGNGSFQGAYRLHKEHGLPIAAIPGTIDNDIEGTEYSIGFDTAVQTAVEAVDKIRDTAYSHARTFIIEVMGRSSPAIALRVGVCTGAETIILPTENIDYKQVVHSVNQGISRGKNSSIIVVAEGEKPGISYEIQEYLRDNHNIETHVCVLGHIQRGGNPTSRERFLASQMGHEAVTALVKKNKEAQALCFLQGRVQTTNLKNCLRAKKHEFSSILELAKTLSI